MVEHRLRVWFDGLRSCARSLLNGSGEDNETQGSGQSSADCNMPKGAGSSPSLLTKLKAPRILLGERIGLPECPYMRRWVLDFGAFAIRLHRWERSDDARHFHDHAWWFLTLVMRGSYVDVSPAGRDELHVGSVRFRPSTHRHTVEVSRPGTWTLLVTGSTERRWGFWVDGKMQRRDRYFATSGHHPCSQTDPPVRMRPNGSRI